MSNLATAVGELPTLSQCIRNLALAIPIPIEDLCTVCQSCFGNDSNATDGDSAMEEDDEEEDDVVRTACGHFFHYSCIQRWFGTTNDTRNKCPNCWTVLFRINMLTPAQTAARLAEDLQRGQEQLADLIILDLPRFTALMAEVDRQFAEHFPINGVNHLPQLIDRVLQWHNEQNGGDEEEEQFLHPDHEFAGDEWILGNCTHRVTELLIDAGVDVDDEDSPGLEEYALYMQQLAEYMSTIWVEDESSDGDASENGQARDGEADQDDTLTPAESPEESEDLVEAQLE